MKTCKIRQKLQFVKSVARNQTDFKVVQIFVLPTHDVFLKFFLLSMSLFYVCLPWDKGNITLQLLFWFE